MFDYDFALQDDFMGSAYLHLESLEQQRCVSVVTFVPHFGAIFLCPLEVNIHLISKTFSMTVATS